MMYMAYKIVHTVHMDLSLETDVYETCCISSDDVSSHVLATGSVLNVRERFGRSIQFKL